MTWRLQVIKFKLKLSSSWSPLPMSPYYLPLLECQKASICNVNKGVKGRWKETIFTEIIHNELQTVFHAVAQTFSITCFYPLPFMCIVLNALSCIDQWSYCSDLKQKNEEEATRGYDMALHWPATKQGWLTGHTWPKYFQRLGCCIEMSTD